MDQANRPQKHGFVWRNRKKSAKLSMLPLITVLPLNYFMDRTEENIRTLALSQTLTQSRKKNK
jgi:hypothetical protein